MVTGTVGGGAAAGAVAVGLDRRGGERGDRLGGRGRGGGLRQLRLLLLLRERELALHRVGLLAELLERVGLRR